MENLPPTGESVPFLSRTRFVFIICSALALILLALSVGYWWTGKRNVPSSQEIRVEAEGFRFGVEMLDPECDSRSGACEMRLVRVSTENGREVIVENLAQLFKQLTGRYVVEKFYFPQNSETIFFSGGNTGSACCSIYAFDTKARTFSALYNGRLDWYGNKPFPSPDNSRVARLGERGKTIEVLFVAEDKVRTVAEAQTGETFVSYYGGYSGDAIGSMVWLDETHLEYGVFEDEPKEGPVPVERMSEREPIKLRTVEVGKGVGSLPDALPLMLIEDVDWYFEKANPDFDETDYRAHEQAVSVELTFVGGGTQRYSLGNAYGCGEVETPMPEENKEILGQVQCYWALTGASFTAYTAAGRFFVERFDEDASGRTPGRKTVFVEI